MLLILLSWTYIFSTTTLVGLFFQQKLHLQCDFLAVQFLGWFGTSLFAALFAVFFPLSWGFQGVLLLLVILLGILYKKLFLSTLDHLWLRFKNLTPILKLFTFIILFLILAKCASAPYVLDNESYYIQTIKWLDTYGLIKGLANLHVYFGLTSGWHILQSAFDFNFLTSKLNDLSGYCLLLGNLYGIKILNDYFDQPQKKGLLFFAVFPFFNVLFFNFISAPSPDIPTYLISWYVFYLVFVHYKKMPGHILSTLSLLIYFLIFIKPTNVYLLVVPLFFIVKDFKKYSHVFLKLFIFGSITLGIIILKNIILTGLPFFPTNLFGSVFSFDFKIPSGLQQFYYHLTRGFAFKLGPYHYQNYSAWQLFLRWITEPKLHGIFNKLVLALIVVFPWFIKKTAHIKPSRFLYFTAVFQLIVLGFTSPQYRFFLSAIFLFLALLGTYLLTNKKLLLTLLTLSVLLTGYQTFFSFSLKTFTNNPFNSKNKIFRVQNVGVPHKNSQYDFGFERLKLGNLNYFSPKDNAFFWNTGDGPLPTVNQVQLNYFKTNLNILPQLRTGDLKDGFYSKNINTP